ncbi:DUF4359 domain-containing protein [Prochlorococcus sp. MIT 1341]|uniref:DUF4359 domain-containing protein n=1 Tax=Prochlorococcus sp. MIT 1341 TaxID=3096221 RepID=UPI002A76343C|nr:DUF4359 domain-containing protein [Prochlorococcus sp. MIT 1341]
MNLKNKFGHNWDQLGISLLGFVAIAGCASALFYTNPSLEEYSSYAGGKLVKIGTEELCDRGVFPKMSNLFLENCPKLISTQRDALGNITAKFTTRWNFGLFSLYTTKVGGEDFLAFLDLPEYKIKTFGVAGQFLSWGVHVKRVESN